MESPVEKYIEWFKSLTNSDQQEIAGFFAHTSPWFGGEKLDFSDIDVETFVEKIREHATGTHTGTGLLLSLIASFEFFFYRERSTEEGWNVVRERLEHAKQYAKDEGVDSMIRTADRMLAELPERAKHWVGVCGKWRTLRDTHLSDKTLNSWFLSDLKTQPEPQRINVKPV